MQVWDYSKNKKGEFENGTCCSSVDVEDARRVCNVLKIPFYVINCEKEFKQKVIDPFVQEYLQGSTPIPCTNCNTFLKFSYLVKKMRELDCNYLATGHYASIKPLKSKKLGLFTSDNSWKDQSYFLFTLDASLLSKLIFPIGNLDKQVVRELAKKHQLPVFNKKDSTGICFVGSSNYKDFIKNYINLSSQEGKLKLYPTGKEIGHHLGIHHFTIGQRKGLGVSYHVPLYVIKIDKESKEVWLGEEKHLYFHEAQVEQLNLLDDLYEGEELKVKVRFHHVGSPALIYKKDKDRVRLKFLKPQKAITPGQSAVFYRSAQLVGGGVITKGIKGESDAV